MIYCICTCCVEKFECLKDRFSFLKPFRLFFSLGSNHSLAQIVGSAVLLTTIACVGTIGNILIFYAVVSQKVRQINKMKSSLYLRNYIEKCDEWRGSSPQLSVWALQLRKYVTAVWALQLRKYVTAVESR